MPFTTCFWSNEIRKRGSGAAPAAEPSSGRTEVEGGRTKVAVASELHTELRSILELDPDHARARHLLGRLHAGVLRMGCLTRWLATNLLGGDQLKQATWEEAERNLSFAEANAPEVAGHHLQLGNLLNDTDRPELALVEVAHVLDHAAVSPMERVVREEALLLKEKLGDLPISDQAEPE